MKTNKRFKIVYHAFYSMPEYTTNSEKMAVKRFKRDRDMNCHLYEWDGEEYRHAAVLEWQIVVV